MQFLWNLSVFFGKAKWNWWGIIWILWTIRDHWYTIMYAHWCFIYLVSCHWCGIMLCYKTVNKMTDWRITLCKIWWSRCKLLYSYQAANNKNERNYENLYVFDFSLRISTRDQSLRHKSNLKNSKSDAPNKSNESGKSLKQITANTQCEGLLRLFQWFSGSAHTN